MDITRSVLIDLENQVWRANKAGDADFYRSYLAENAIAIAPHGVFERDAIIKQITENKNPLLGYRLDTPRVIMMTKDNAIVTYRATVAAKQDEKDVTFSVYATTVYARVNGEWRAVLHQQTPAR